MAVIDKITSLIGGSVTDGVAKIISLFKVDPNLALQKQVEIEEIKLQMAGKLQDAISNEITQSAEVIKAEAQSQSWLPRNVRPLLLLLWGIAITFNSVVPIIARFWIPGLSPFPLDPWVYKLTAIGFTGYVTARTWEKVTDSDN
jgi:VIT1/CCC1 family predicted Fe2+/Mn2+ transporter